MRRAALFAVALVVLIGSPAAAQFPASGDIVTLAPSQQAVDPSCDVQVGTHLDMRILADASRSPLVISRGHVLILTGGTWANHEFPGVSVAL